MHYLIFPVAALVVFLTLRLARNNDRLDRILKGLVLAYCTICFIRFLLPDAFIYQINGAWFEEHYYNSTDILGLVLRWGYYTNCVVLPMAVFTSSRLFRNIASYFSLPFSIASVVCTSNYMQYYLAPEGHGYHLPTGVRYAVFVCEMLLALVIPIILQIAKKHVFRLRDKTEWKNFLLGLVAVVIMMLPAYAPQAIFGYDVVTPGRGSNYHLIWVGVLFVVTLAIYFFFRFRSYEDRNNLVLFFTLLLFFHYDSLYMMGVNITRLPFQLCNIASYFYMICVIFKLNKMFQFCFVANTVGALFAILFPDFGVGDLSFWNTHFIIEHTLVLWIAAFGMGLRIFPRFSKKTLKYFAIGYTIYVFCVYVLGTILNGFSDITGQTVNYFYMFDFETAYDYFPFARFLEDYVIHLGRFTLYPLFPLLVYFGFGLLCILFYLLIKVCYKIEDDHLELRLSGIELYEKITKKPSRRPKHFID